MELVPNWDAFRERFPEILESLPVQRHCLAGMEGDLEGMPNILLYGVYGFPLDLLWGEGLRRRFGVECFRPTACTWGKDIVYMETPYYLHLDLEHPSMPKEVEVLQEFLKSIITTQSALSQRHVIVIEHIDSLVRHHTNMNTFRVLLERFSKNAWFICTTYHMGKLEQPIRSRFHCIRVPLPTEEEVQEIMRLLGGAGSGGGARGAEGTRNIFQALTGAPGFVFPPVVPFVVGTGTGAGRGAVRGAAGPTIDEVRAVTYRAFQCGVEVAEFARDILEACLLRGDGEEDLHQTASVFAHYEHLACQSKGKRTLLYMEYMLHYAAVIVPDKKTKVTNG